MAKIRYNFTMEQEIRENLLNQLAEWNNRTASAQLEAMIKEEFLRQSTAFGAGMSKAKEIFTAANEKPETQK